MKRILSYLWQLPQNLLGLVVIFFSKARKDGTLRSIYNTNKHFGVSLGNYIIIYEHCSYNDIKHEWGHQKQSLYLGWFYLLVIGLLSLIGNVVDRICHKVNEKHSCWYYKQPWERWADKLGGVKR